MFDPKRKRREKREEKLFFKPCGGMIGKFIRIEKTRISKGFALCTINSPHPSNFQDSSTKIGLCA